jgi:hypothetical protein
MGGEAGVRCKRTLYCLNAFAAPPRDMNYAVITKGAALANAAQHADLEPVLADAEAAGALALELAMRTFGYLFQCLVGLRCKMS